MKDWKQLKDPIYGYIDVPCDYMENIVDTAVFQRLRRITQTSYAPLYASALHNRFVHSLGVYHLGEIAGKTLKDEIEKRLVLFKGQIDENKLADIVKVFSLACLLHDVGHSPFFHTGESFFAKDGSSVDYLHNKLSTVVHDAAFKKDSGVDTKNIISAQQYDALESLGYDSRTPV